MKRRLLLVVVLLLALVVRAQYGEPPSRRRYTEGKWSGDGWLLERPGAVPILFMSGTPEEMGRQHGALLKNLIATTYSRILLVAGGYLYLKDDWFFDRIEEVERRVGAVLPDRFLRECDAMSAAAGLTRAQGRALNLFPEMFHCSGIAARGKATRGGQVVHARVLDYMRDIGLQKTSVLQVFMPSGFNAWISVGFAGFNGTVTCMNEKGLAMGEMGGRGEGKWDGLPMSYLMRRVMEECATVEDALALIRATPLTCTYYYVLSDASGNLAAVEADAGKPIQVLGPGEKHPLLGKTFEDVVYVTAPKRMPALVARLEENYGRIDADAMCAIVKRPVAMASNLHNAIFLPETRDILFSIAGAQSVACDEPYDRVNLMELLARYRNARVRPAAAPVVVGIADMCMTTNSISVQTTYAAAFARAGNTPLVLPAETNREVVARMLAPVDVLLLCGGEDVDPSRYKTKSSPRLEEVNLRRDDWEFLLLDEAVKRRLPVIGICRGCQLINVYFGGTLWQDLPSERPGEVAHRGKGASHDIKIVAGSRLARSLGLNSSKVNTIHHQAVRDLAPGFRAVAFAPDGVVEAIESDALPVVGVQFHPEKLFVLKDRDEFRVLFADPLKWTRP